MATTQLTDEEILHRGLEVLFRELGPDGFLRFLMQFESGEGDYSTERHKWLGESSLEDLIKDLKRRSGQDS